MRSVLALLEGRRLFFFFFFLLLLSAMPPRLSSLGLAAAVISRGHELGGHEHVLALYEHVINLPQEGGGWGSSHKSQVTSHEHVLPLMNTSSIPSTPFAAATHARALYDEKGS